MIATYYDLDMNEIDTKDLWTLKIDIPSIPFNNQRAGGNDNILPIHLGTDVQQRPITATIELVSKDYYDYNLLKSRLYEIFGYNKPFYVVDNREPYKRYRVILDNNFLPTRHGIVNGSVDIQLITEQFPYAESIGTTQDIENNGLSSDDELWGYEMGLQDDDYIYTHNSFMFDVYNAGNVAIHPFESQYFKITVSDINEAFELKNLTNGTTFKVTEDVNGTVEIDGPNVTINGLNALRKTNRQFIELSPGWNQFEITIDATVEFDFRFYYR